MIGSEEERMREILRDEMSRNRIPGGMFGLWKDGREVFCAIEGMADLEAGKPLSRDSLFRIYSMTKPVTAVAAMMLEEAGELRLSDRVAEYLPEFAEMSRVDASGNIVPCEREMTIWNLFSMSSGLVYPDQDPAGRYMQRYFDSFQPDNLAGHGPSTRELAALAARQPLAFEPGDGWRYGLSADVLGAIIEVISGQRFGEFLRERIFEPLDMRDTGFYVPPERAHRLVQLYKSEGGALQVDRERHLALTLCLTPPTFESGGAGLIASLDDYAKFGNMLANRGVANGRRLLSEHTIERFQAGMVDHTFDARLGEGNLKGYNYGYFMRALRDPIQADVPGSVGEFGWDGWTGPHVSVDPQAHVLMVFMTQVGGYGDWDLLRQMHRVALSAL